MPNHYRDTDMAMRIQRAMGLQPSALGTGMAAKAGKALQGRKSKLEEEIDRQSKGQHKGL